MAHSLSQVYLHIVFGTKYRKPMITRDIEEELYAYIGGIIRNMKGAPLEINGMSEHIHILSVLPRTVSISKLLEEIKKNSSKWIKSKGSQFSKFYWQNGYAAFSVSHSNVSTVQNYIKNQKSHHSVRGFKMELISLLKKHSVAYDEKYLWD